MVVPLAFMSCAVAFLVVVRRSGDAMLCVGTEAGFDSRNALQGHRNDKKGGNDEAKPVEHGGYCINRKPACAQSRTETTG